MKLLVFGVLVVALGVVFASDEKYTTKYDNINLDNILDNERLVLGYCKCLWNEGPCTPEGTALKDAIKEALETDCEKCSEKQKSGGKKVIVTMIKKYREYWDKTEKLYDPNRTYVKKYAEELKKEGVTL